MRKKTILICWTIIILALITILVETVISYAICYIKFGYNDKDSVIETDYKVKYTMENVITNFYTRIKKLNDNELNLMFLNKSKISLEEAKKIIDAYELKEYNYDLVIDKVCCLAEKKNIYLCEYTLEYTSNILDDGIDMTINESKESVAYKNIIIVKLIDENKYKVLYNKIDLGGGIIYER